MSIFPQKSILFQCGFTADGIFSQPGGQVPSNLYFGKYVQKVYNIIYLCYNLY